MIFGSSMTPPFAQSLHWQVKDLKAFAMLPVALQLLLLAGGL